MTFTKIYPLIFLPCLFLLGACHHNTNQTDNQDAHLVKTITLSPTQSAQNLVVSGNIEGNKTVRLGFMVAGRINYIAAEEGQTVKAHTVLASLDPENYQIAKDIADANLAQTQDEYNRLTEMYETNSVSASDYAKITSGLKIAKAQQRLQAKNLRETKLYAPIDGILIKRGAEVAEIIDQGMPLFAVAQINTVKVNAAMPESDLKYIQLGDTAAVYISSLDTTLHGKVIEIGALAEANTRTFPTKIELSNPKGLIKPGMTAEITIHTAETRETISIPADAIRRDVDNTSYVFIADVNKHIAIKRKVSLGNITGNNIQVISGLQPTEQLIVAGQHQLNNGTPITLN